MDNSNLRSIIADQLSSVPESKRQLFAWICAMRSLPFLGADASSDTWNEKKAQSYILSIFRTLDYTISISSADEIRDTLSKVAEMIRDSQRRVAYLAAAVYSAGLCAISLSDVARRNFMIDAAYYSTLSAQKEETFFSTLLSDLNVITGQECLFEGTQSIYGTYWNSFHSVLKKYNCQYWYNWYSSTLSGNFQIDSEQQNEISVRLGAPIEVIAAGAASVAAYVENILQQGGTCNIQRDTRIIILGSAGAGKTTLARRLNEDLSFPAPFESTHGVDTSICIDLHGVNAHLWDFGGQIIYHSSHRCFITPGCIFLLVINARDDENRDIPRINYWLDTIRSYTNGIAQIFIILNEIDSRKQNVDDFSFLKKGIYGKLIQEIYSFNIGSDYESLLAFKEDLANFVESVGYYDLAVKDCQVISKIKDSFLNHKQVLPEEDLRKMFQDSGITTTRNQRQSCELLNTLGIALSYDFIPDYIIDPYWISHGIYKVIDYLQEKKRQFVGYSDFNEIFIDEIAHYPEMYCKYIYDLMAFYKIGFPNRTGIRGLIVPCAASIFKPISCTSEPNIGSLEIQIERENLEEFPADFFYKYICANNNDICQNNGSWSMWQSGMVLSHQDASAQVELLANRRIVISVWGPEKEEFAKTLEERINALLQEYSFGSRSDSKKWGDKVTKIITVFVETVTKAVTSAWIESIMK